MVVKSAFFSDEKCGIIKVMEAIAYRYQVSLFKRYKFIFSIKMPAIPIFLWLASHFNENFDANFYEVLGLSTLEQ